VTDPEGAIKMNTTAATDSLQWDVLTIKRPGLSRDVPPGKEN
jgi:hypothetical protein